MNKEKGSLMLITDKDWYKEIIKEYPRLNKFVQNFITYRNDFTVVESLYLAFYSMKRHHAKIIRQRIYDLSHNEYGEMIDRGAYPNRLNVFHVTDELFRTLPIHSVFSGLENIHGYKLSTGLYLEICSTRASIANMAGQLNLCTATRKDLIIDQLLGKMLRINVKDKKEIIANICVHAEKLLTNPKEKNVGFYILEKDHKFWDENHQSKMFFEIKQYLNTHLKIYDHDIEIP